MEAQGLKHYLRLQSRAVSRVVRKNNELSFNAMLAFAAGFLTCVAMEMLVWWALVDDHQESTA
jgi:hypothetical protein